MNRSTQIWVGVVVLAGLAGAVYYKSEQDKKIGTASTTSADLPEMKVDSDGVDKISITNTDKPEIVLEKKGDKWEMTKPVQAPANQANVKSVLDNLKDLKAKEVIFEKPTDDMKKENNFEPSKGVAIKVWKGGDKKADYVFGKSGSRGQLAMVEGKPSIYAVNGYSSYLYAREPKGFRETEIFKFEDANVVNWSIEKKDGTLSFTKNGDKWAGTYKDKAIERFDEEKVKDALRALKSLNADDFGDGKSVADTGLDKPESTVTINLKDNAGKYILRVGKTATGTSRFAMKSDNDTIYVIPQWTADWTVAEPSKFQKPVDAGAPAASGKPGMPPGMPGMPPGMGADPHGH